MIPKIIHYCWYGNEKPNSVKKCLSIWEILNDYKVIEWNEKNCDFTVNNFVKTAVQYERWGYVSDYFRWIALYEQGGIYLDTDVQIYKKFDGLLNNQAFMGFIFDSSLGTAVLGFEEKHPLLKIILELYDKAYWLDEYHIEVQLPDGSKKVCKVNNDVLTGVLLCLYSEFLLNGKRQQLSEGILVLPKEELELGYIFGGGYCVHKCQGSWHNMSLVKRINTIVKKVVAIIPGIHLDVAIRTVTYRTYLKQTPYYSIYLEHKRKHSRRGD